MDVNNLDLHKIVDVIIKHDFKIIALQFADEYLANCVDVYSALQVALAERLSENTIELYITADSSYGSSIDDVSAMHVDCQLIIMFGTDLSSSGTIPTIVAPFRKTYDLAFAASAICDELKSDKKKSVVLLSDLCHFHLLGALRDEMAGRMGASDTTAVGRLPASADLDAWSADSTTDGNRTMAGGLSIDAAFLLPDADSGDSAERVVVYVGEKEEQLQNILFSLSQYPVLHYRPASQDLAKFGLGLNSRELRARYGGIARVKDAKVVGLLIGSMGLSQTKMQSVMQRLQGFISAAKKKCYVFVMGRLNEAKLCNFPEVDIFCLIGNDDNCYIPPKTFPVPVITPFELEIGLGARTWCAHLETLGDSADLSADEVDRMVGLIREFFISSDDESEEEDGDEGRLDEGGQDEGADIDESVNANTSSTHTNSGSSGSGSNSNALVKTLKPEEQQLVDFKSSPAIEFFQNRQYQGLVSTIVDPADANAAGGDNSSAEDGVEQEGSHGTVNIYKIHQGSVGIASKYER